VIMIFLVSQSQGLPHARGPQFPQLGPVDQDAYALNAVVRAVFAACVLVLHMDLASNGIILPCSSPTQLLPDLDEPETKRIQLTAEARRTQSDFLLPLRSPPLRGQNVLSFSAQIQNLRTKARAVYA
jgi:hypothetical protein